MAKAIIFSEIVFNFLLIVQISDRLRTKSLIAESVPAKIICAFIIWILVWAIAPNITLIPFSFLVCFPSVILSFTPIFLHSLRKNKFRSELAALLNEIILNMRGGRSFRPALQLASQNLSTFTQNKIEKTIELLTLDPLSQSKSVHDPEIEIVLKHFRSIEIDSHQALPRLIQFREKIKMEDKLKKKIHQALSQIRAQAWILSILYVGLLIVLLLRSHRLEPKMIVLSVILFAVGLIATIWQGRRFRWKV